MRLLRFAIALVVAVPLATIGGSDVAQAKTARDLTVMTQNLYLGSDLAPAMTAQTQEELVVGVATIYGTMLFTNFPARSAAIANEIQANHPDLVGLEEVSNWITAGPTTAPSLDYLAILQAQLAGRGLHYTVAAVSHNASIGPLPLAGVPCDGPFGACTLTFQDRDVILVNDDTSGLSVTNPRSGTYPTQEVLSTPAGPLSFDRGWATVDTTFGDRSFRFAVTHLETEAFPAVQQAQGAEFVSAIKTPGSVLAVGDFNSASDGSQTTTYASLTSDYFRDAWTGPGLGLSCCQSGTLTNPTSQLATRIDLVLTHGFLQPTSAHLVGDTPFEAAPPFWPSDHAGLVATLRMH